MDSTGHIALTDFGLCKEGVKEGDVTNTFCGTAEYLAPEVLRGGGYGKSVDWWSLGILFYEMLFGLPPFYDENTNLMCIIFLTLDEKILNAPLLFPASFPEPAKSLCISLLQRDPTNRIGSGPEDAEEIKRHLFFKDIDWQRLLKKGIKPPYKPHVDSDIDTSNFDPVFTSELVVDSLPNASAPLSDTLQLNFQGFTFNGDDQI